MTSNKIADWTIVQIGLSLSPEGWTEDNILKQKPGATGYIIGYSDSHGLCYKVRHRVDGSTAYYNPEDLTIIKSPRTNSFSYEEMCPDCRDNRATEDIYSKCICGPPEKYICLICDDWLKDINSINCCEKCIEKLIELELPHFYLYATKYKRLIKFIIEKSVERQAKEQSKKDMAEFFRKKEEQTREYYNDKEVKAILEKIYEQREEILTAFVAKYNCQPDECVQVIQHTYDKEKYWIKLTVDKEDSSENTPK
jgi:hypothetical protein